MRTTGVFALGVLLSGFVYAADPSNASVPAGRTLGQQIASEASEAKTAAEQIAAAAKDKRAGLDGVLTRIADVEQRAAKIHELIGQLESRKDNLNAAQQAELDRLKQLSALLKVFVDNKKSAAVDAVEGRNRQALRNHALGVATRAGMIEKSAGKLGV